MAELTFKNQHPARQVAALDEEAARIHDPCNSKPGTGANP